MARWLYQTEGSGAAVESVVDYSDPNYVDFVMKQHNIDEIKREVERDRSILEKEKKVGAWRKAFTIPDIVAMEILMVHGLDVHAPDMMSDKHKLDKLKYIVKTEYPYLLIST